MSCEEIALPKSATLLRTSANFSTLRASADLDSTYTMSEERPFVLILLTWLLRALNALFLVVCFPLHKLVSLTAPHVTKEEPDAAVPGTRSS